MVGYIENPHDKIRVFADFYPASFSGAGSSPIPVNGTGRNNTRVRPIAFFWAGRRYDVASVNLVYRRRVGKHNVWCFAVSDVSNTFILSYEPNNMEWMLDEVQGQ